MRTGFLISGIVLLLIGIGLLLAVASSAANCPTGYVCSPNPVGLTLGSILLVFGIILVILAFVLKREATTQSAARNSPPRRGSSPAASLQARFCSQCRAPARQGAAFCESCGALL